MKKQNLIKWPNPTNVKTFIISLILIIAATMACKLAETKERSDKIHQEVEKVSDALIKSGGSADASYQKAIEKVSLDFHLSEQEETQLMKDYIL